MTQPAWISFLEAIQEVQSCSRAVLLGNGFSIAQVGQSLAYSNLRKESDIDKKTSLESVFDTFNTSDFEKIIRYLETAEKVAQAYNREPEASEYKTDAKEVREQLIKAIKKVHPPDFDSIPPQEINSCVIFLKNFGKVFTLNYDLLLYWVLISSDAFIDGFGYGKREGSLWGPFNREAFNMDGKGFFYNIHGGLHLFLSWPYRDVYKAIANRGDNLLNSITNIIHEENRLPLYVAEGTFEQKLDKIRSVPYLNYCLEELQGLSGVLFVFGHSGNRTDEHIYDAIFKSRIATLYYCIYDATQLSEIRGLLEEYRTKHNNYIPIKYIYAGPGYMNIWGK